MRKLCSRVRETGRPEKCHARGISQQSLSLSKLRLDVIRDSSDLVFVFRAVLEAGFPFGVWFPQSPSRDWVWKQALCHQCNKRVAAVGFAHIC